MSPAPVTLHGIANCDSVKKARAWLDGQGVAYRFHDFKKQGVSPEMLVRWAARVGWEPLLNRRGTTWRQLASDEQQRVVDAASAFALMQAQPSLIKRPVIEAGDAVLVGFDPMQYAALTAPR
ncbi:MAG TPA: ArsC family reductase [Methylibium sp.]|uniref:ArsC family reductase n=1 Tax=Methylibium sp. TaxID=2067992 RepID=UPI002DBD1DD8|nr:ArsC family reductase [Methylibium sp.]HEU4457821.1 ArsC family reductase [Methylibium sp.]